MHLIDTIIPYIKQYGYWAIFGVIFLESLGFPLPGETFIVVATLCAIKGMINPIALVWLSILATFLANNLSYWVGYKKGSVFVTKYGKYFFINTQRLHKAEKFVKKHGDIVVIFARFIFAFRQLNGLIMGVLQMPFIRYMLLNLIGAILWVCGVVIVSYGFGTTFFSFTGSLR